MTQHDSERHGRFEREALHGGQSLPREFWAYLMHTKKWWMTPIVLMLLVLAGLIVLGGRPATRVRALT
jgi:hypothetical protein